MKQRIRLTESDLHRIVKESVRRIVEDTKAQRKKDPMNQWFKDMDDAQKHRDNMEYITKGGKNPNKKKLKEDISLEHEDKLRQLVGTYAQQIKNIIDSLTSYASSPTGENYLADLVKNEEWINDLWHVYFSMEEFAKTSADRQREEEERLATPDGGFERFGY